MVTSFGKFLRILRINNGEILKTMADKLGVSSAFLSAVENGKKEIPIYWREKLIDKYNLSNSEIKSLSEAIVKSQKELKIDLKSLDDSDKDLAIAFARKFSSLGDKEKNEIMTYLNNH